MYQYFDENPDTTVYVRGKKKGEKKPHTDCVVRCMMQAWGVNWRTAFKMLSNVACELGCMPSEPGCWRYFCRKSPNRTPYIGEGRKLKSLKEFAAETKGDDTAYIVHTREHLVFVQDGIYRDAWDSGWMAVSSIWELE